MHLFSLLYAIDFRTSGPSWTNPVTSGSGNYLEFERIAFGTFVGPLSLKKNQAMKNWARRGCLFLGSILFKVTWAFERCEILLMLCSY